MNSAIKYLHERDKLQKNNYFFALMKLEHDKRLSGFLIWNISFFDLTLEESIFTVGVDAVTGEVKYPDMRSELLNADFFHIAIENENYVINLNRQLKAIDNHIWDIPDPNENSDKRLSAREAMSMAGKLLEADVSQQWKFGFISNTGVLKTIKSSRFNTPQKGLMKRDGTAGQWVIEVYSRDPQPVSEQGKKGFAYEFKQILVTREDAAQFIAASLICNFTALLSQSSLPHPLLDAYEKAQALAVKHAVAGFSVMSVALRRFTGGDEWQFRFYDTQDIILSIRVSGDGTRIIATSK